MTIYRVTKLIYRVTGTFYRVKSTIYRVRSLVYRVTRPVSKRDIDAVGGVEFLPPEESIEVDVWRRLEPFGRKLCREGLGAAGNGAGQQATSPPRRVGDDDEFVVGVAVVVAVAEGDCQHAVGIQAGRGDVGLGQRAFADNDTLVVDAIGAEAIPVEVLEAGEGGWLSARTFLSEALFVEPDFMGSLQVGRELCDKPEALAMGLLLIRHGLGECLCCRCHSCWILLLWLLLGR